MLSHDQLRHLLPSLIRTTDFAGLGQKRTGKVRDVYVSDNQVMLIATDRQSAFDRLLACVPCKGQVLSQTSAWWFRKTAHLVPNHLIDTPDPNVVRAKPVTIFPVEFVVRGYLTGVTQTSVWTVYAKGVREYCGVRLPEGMRRNEKFSEPILTPTTKSDTHDEPISPDEIIGRGLMTREEWETVAEMSRKLFTFGQQESARRGLLLVDTKYEFGRDRNGQIVVADEIHTPDSSRFWIADTYPARWAANAEPENIDKEFFRLWFVKNGDPYGASPLPPAPEELVLELASRYIQLFEKITGETFTPVPGDPIRRMRTNLGL